MEVVQGDTRSLDYGSHVSVGDTNPNHSRNNFISCRYAETFGQEIWI